MVPDRYTRAPRNFDSPPTRTALCQLVGLKKEKLKQIINRNKDQIQCLCLETYIQNSHLYPPPPTGNNVDENHLHIVVKAWMEEHVKPGIELDLGDNSDDDSGQQPPPYKKRKRNPFNLEAFQGQYDCDSSESYGKYQGKGERVNVFLWDFTRTLVHFYLNMSKNVPEAVKYIFYGAGCRQGREMSTVEIEYMTLAYTIHAFFAQAKDLEDFMAKPLAIGLQYPMRRLYVLLQMETEVLSIYPTRIKAWDHYKVLLKEYTTNTISNKDKVKSGVGKLISMELKTKSEDTKWDDIQYNKRKAKRDKDDNRN